MHLVSQQYTDVTPFDTGAYASCQSYVSGHAVRKTAMTFRKNNLDILNVHDSDRILDPATAEGQVQGGMAQGIGAALYEEQLVDPATGRLRNNNLLDYKIPSSMDDPSFAASSWRPTTRAAPTATRPWVSCRSCRPRPPFATPSSTPRAARSTRFR